MDRLKLPVLALRDIVVFPQVSIPLYVGRTRSLRALECADPNDKLIFLVTQRDPQVTDPVFKDLYEFGCIARIRQQAKLPDGNLKLLIEGLHVGRVTQVLSEANYLSAEVESLSYPASEDQETEKAFMRNTISSYEAYLKALNKSLDEFFKSLETYEDPHKLVSVICTHSGLKLKDKQEILEILPAQLRLERLSSFLISEIEIIKLDRKIKNKVREKIEKSQKDYYLQEQLSAIHKELGNEDQDPKSEIADLEKRLAAKKMPEAAKERAKREIRKLKSSGHSAESSVIRNYVDLMLDLPWNEYSTDSEDLAAAEKILDEDHYGLRDIKERLIEFLAVRARASHHKSPIVCLVGPPGVGKTSLARSVARALNRKFEKISLGGMRDEAELRGHRRTYIGALPGKIITAIKKAQVSNPVILLDEIDKMGADWRGDPASSLLEILDPEQNKIFNDHYLDLDYDLSKVLFITTANLLENMSAPLRDRLEVIRLSGYSDDEKIAIGRNYILPKVLENHGLSPAEIEISDEVLSKIVSLYTKEAGVRSLEREISKLCRKAVRALAKSESPTPIKIGTDLLVKYLGAARFQDALLTQIDQVGVANGLAWTSLGGETLQIEVAAVPGKGKIEITGQLGAVMQESAKAAITYIRSRSEEFGIVPDYFSTHDLHIHVPEGATPKDGPSAGITLTSAVLSAVTGLRLKSNLAMTGEITLRGRVLPIGGLKEKLLAARRAGLKQVIYPLENQKDLAEIEPRYLDGLKLFPVYDMAEVIDIAFADRVVRVPTPERRSGSSPEIQLQEKPVSSHAPNVSTC